MQIVRNTGKLGSVALRKESVDRNIGQVAVFSSAAVALRKESVDRNSFALCVKYAKNSRSPQGERG